MSLKQTLKVRMDLIRTSALLWGIFCLIRYAAYRYRSIRERVSEKDRTIGIRTAGGAVGRRYLFESGRVLSVSGGGSSDAALVWQDAGDIFTTLLSGYDGDMMRAFQGGRVMIEGDAGEVFWFFSTLREIKDRLRG